MAQIQTTSELYPFPLFQIYPSDYIEKNRRFENTPSKPLKLRLFYGRKSKNQNSQTVRICVFCVWNCFLFHFKKSTYFCILDLFDNFGYAHFWIKLNFVKIWIDTKPTQRSELVFQFLAFGVNVSVRWVMKNLLALIKLQKQKA